MAQIKPLPNAWEPDLVDPVRQAHTDKIITKLGTQKFSTEYHNDDNEWNNQIISSSSHNGADREPGLGWLAAKKASKKTKKAAKKGGKKAKKGGKKAKGAKKAKKAKKGGKK